ncbi:MAG: patatin-like phospholipase family protein [Acidimicrobiia bacterium]|nr:patatin-like phospholipase family protein [Acidimicrobiia bacterium]MDH4308906.1 patatin-like phospholipase family protein [Acidimicrobiia bacterium]MDH5295001.1 patatin-like phospholipase family protein [Acidimicrobiia bacterium]
MSSVGLVLGGGGVTGAAYEMAALMAIELATGWSANTADVVVGTSAGSFVAAMVRHDRLVLDSLVRHGDERADVAARIAGHLFNRKPGVKVGTWVRHGLLPGVRKPGLTMLLGSPAPFEANGLADWVRSQIGDSADSWPIKPTVVTAFDVEARRRVAFGTDAAPDVGIAEAVAASSAIPLVFRPYRIGQRMYVDGGVMSGTHADLVLGSGNPLDLILILAPMAADTERDGARFYERLFDQVGSEALQAELRMIRDRWPNTDVLVLRPTPATLSAMRPNPMDPNAAVPTFVRTLSSMKRVLARPEVWTTLARHLVPARAGR